MMPKNSDKGHDVLAGRPYSLESLLTGQHDQWLWDMAGAERQRVWGRRVNLRGIVEFSSHCRQNCLYCGLRHANKPLQRYRLTWDEAFEAAAQVAELGFGTVVLQSGEDDDLNPAELAALIKRIKRELGLVVTLSVGERPPADYALWRAAGADRFLLKMETFNPNLYAVMRPGRRFEDRLAALKTIKSLGYATGSGIIAGLPGERPDDLAGAVRAMADLGLAMVSISPFSPHPQTPLGENPAEGADKVMRLMAVVRLALPSAHIPVTSALGLFGDDVRLKALEVGDVLMPSLTPEKVKEGYAIYPGKNSSSGHPAHRAAQMRGMLLANGFEPAVN